MQETDAHSGPFLNALSIRTMPDGFSFWYNSAKGDVLKELRIPSVFEFNEKFENFVKLRGWAGKEQTEVTLLDFSNHFMVLPDKITEEEHIKSFFDFQFQHEEPHQIFTVPLCDGKQIFCWEVPCSRDQFFEELFPKLTTFNSAYLLTNWTLREAGELKKPVLTVHLFGDSMQLFVANPEKLLFTNFFSIKDTQEIPYFLLRCLDQLGLDPLQIKCTFCCENFSEKEIFDLFAPYIQTIEMVTFTHQIAEPLQISENFNNLHANR